MAIIVAVSDEIYKDNLLTSLSNFSKDGCYTDITLVLKNKEINVHRVVLAAASDVFAKMLQVDMKEKFEGRINFTNFGLQDQTIEEIVEYIYTGKLNISIENVEELLSCANFFMLSRLHDDCCEFLLDLLCPGNCLGMLSLATKFVCKKIEDKALKMIQEDFLSIVYEEEYLQLSKDDLFGLLSNDFLEIMSEDDILKALFRWLEYDFDKRYCFFDELLQSVRIQFLTNESFLGISSYEKILDEAIIIKKVLLEANENSLTEHQPPRKCLDTSIVIMTTGGYDGNSCLVSSFALPIENSKWGHLAPMQVSRHDHGTVSHNNKVFVVGGFNSRGGPLNRAEYYNSVRNEWVEMPPMTSKRKSLGVCVHANKLFVSGGLDGNYNALNSVEFYDVEHEVWFGYFKPMNQARYSHGFVANEKGLFAIGGWKLETAERYYDGRWRMIAPLSTYRAGATTIIRNNHIYVFGGYSSSECVPTVEIYDIELDYWSRGSPANISRWRAGSAIVDNMIYVIGGRNSSWQYLDAVESYDLEKDEWKQEESLPCKMMGLRCSVLKVPKHAIR